ncbi:hypothetical protein G6F59_015547 [Rhizopus arrhizus]|nr:hypothetical protein G6F59_015547 [Rhizopus arrhizus]
MVHPIVGVAGKARQAIRPGAVLGQRAGEVTRHLPAAIAAGIQVQLAQRVGRGAFADGVDHTARTQLPIQHRRRAAQHFHPFQPIRFLPAVVDAGLQFQAVAQLPGVPRGHIETAQHQPSASATDPALTARICSLVTTDTDCGVSISGVSVLVPDSARCAT